MKHTTKIIGLTGSIASGKTTVTKYLRKRGYPVICADEIAHAVTNLKSVLKKITLAFGKEVLFKDGSLNRKKMALIVFSDEKKRKELENIIHPAIRQEIFAQIKNLEQKKCPLIFLDIPLLFENGWEKICDKTICVATSKALQLKRLIKNRGMTRKEALARIASQMPLKEKIKRADFVLNNRGTIAELHGEIKKILW